MRYDSLNPRAVPLQLTEEAARMMYLCNACRYCEGYCAVFPAMERRLTFSEKDLNYLANLCHNCGECYQACPYSPPHEFNLNLPRKFAEIRLATYQKYAWPGCFSALFRRNGVRVAAALIAGPAILLLIVLGISGPAKLVSSYPDAAGAFYAVLSHVAMVSVFSFLSLFVLGALIAGFASFWREAGVGSFWSPPVWAGAIMDTLRLRYLEGGGHGCTGSSDVPSRLRRWFHHLTFYGFMLCFASTSVAAIYHYVFSWPAPYPLLSMPVVLGVAGGVGLLIGPLGLLGLKVSRGQHLSDPQQAGMDMGFLVLLFLTSISGLLLTAFRESHAMGTLLVIHLGTVVSMFATMPYGKFVHAVYRFGALLRNRMESR
jgi:citrate/tricarballylate utilization protein